MQVIITPHALMAPIHYNNLDIDDFLLHYQLLKFFSGNQDFCTSHVFSDTVEILSENGLFPAHQTFQQYLAQNELEDEISPRDLVTLFYSIMDNCEDIKEKNQIHDFEIDSSFSFPQITATPICNSFTNNSIALCGYLEHVQSITVHPLIDCNIISDEYKHIIPKISVLCDDGLLDVEDLEVNVSLYKSCTELINCYSSIELWRRATTSFSYKLAIYYKCKEILASQSRSIDMTECMDSFDIGPRFIESLNSHQCSASGRFSTTLLDSLSRLLLDDPKNEVKVFTTSAGSATPRTRGQDLAYRLHVTKSGEGIRLMFWKKACNTIELANVANKSEIVIY